MLDVRLAPKMDTLQSYSKSPNRHLGPIAFPPFRFHSGYLDDSASPLKLGHKCAVPVIVPRLCQMLVQIVGGEGRQAERGHSVERVGNPLAF